MKHLALFAVIGILLAGCQRAPEKPEKKEKKPTKIEKVKPPPAEEKKMTNVVTSGSPDTIKFAVAWSTKADPAEAGAEAATSAIDALGCDARGIVFFTYYQDKDFKPKKESEVKPDPAAEQAVANAVAKAAGQVPNIGGRARPLTNGGTLLKNAVSVLAIGGKQAACKTASASLPKDDRKGPGQKIAAALKDVKGLKVVISLSNPNLSFGAAEGVNVEDYIRAITAGTPDGVALFGGNTMPFGGDPQHPKVENAQYISGKGYANHVVAMGVGGPIEIFFNHTNEFKPSAKTATVTKADGKWVVTLDDKPAADVYRELRGMKTEEKFTSDWQHPIGVVVAPDKVYLRMILDWIGADGKDSGGKASTVPAGSLRFVSPVVQGTKVKCLAGGDDARAIVASASEGIKESVAAAKAAKAAPALAMISNCCARGMRLRTFRKGNDDEVPEAILPALKTAVPVFGFYAWGELGQIRGEYQGLKHQYQQHTFVSALVGIKK